MTRTPSHPSRRWHLAGAAAALGLMALAAVPAALAQAWPGEVDREALIAQAFRTRRPDETHRVRLRVDIGRLRALIKTMARIEATDRGFVLQALGGRDVVVLKPPFDGDQASLLALLLSTMPAATSRALRVAEVLIAPANWPANDESRKRTAGAEPTANLRSTVGATVSTFNVLVSEKGLPATSLPLTVTL